MPVTDSIAHSLTTGNKVHFHNVEGRGKGKGRHHGGSGFNQGRQVEIQKKLVEITKKGAEWEQVMDRRISGGKLERY